jgi:general secretion pathway protein I
MSEKGFTLIEVLVALTILALALTIIFGGLSDGLRGKQAAANYQRATTLAESKLSAMGVEDELQEGQSKGQFDQQFRWEAIVTPYHEEGRNESSQPTGATARPLVLTVTVLWGDKGKEKSVSLSTLHLDTQQKPAGIAPTQPVGTTP